MNYYFSNVKGFSLVEVVVAMGITTIIVAAGGQMLANVFIRAKNAETATAIMNDLSVASKLIDRDLAGAGINLNTTVVSDIANRDFFTYLPYAPSAEVNFNEERKIILSLDNIKYPQAVQEFVFLVTERSWPIPLMFSPRKAFLQGGTCEEASSLVYNGDCLFNQNINSEASTEFGPEVLTSSSDAFYLFQLPEYFIPTANPSRLLSYSFLAAPDAASQASVAVNNIGISNIVSTSTTSAQSNKYTTITSTHPSGILPTTLDQYLTKIPFYAGEGTSFNVSKVRLIKYLIVPHKLGGQDSTALFRLELKRNSDTQFQSVASTLVAEGFDSLILTRKSISDSIINITFDRQFKLSGSSKGEL